MIVYVLSEPGSSLPQHTFTSLENLAKFLGKDTELVTVEAFGQWPNHEPINLLDKSGKLWELWLGIS